MRPKALLQLSAVLAALVVLTITAMLWNRPAQPALFAPAALAGEAVRVEAEGPSGKISLERHKSGWSAAAFKDYPADGTLVADLLGKLSKGTVSGPLTEDAERYALFGFSASSATRIKVATAKASPALDFYVGKDGPDYPSAFVRLPGQAGVFQVSGVGAFELVRAPGDWLDRKIARGPAEAVTHIAVRGTKAAWELRFSSGVWTLGRRAVPADRADSIVRPIREAAGALEADTVAAADAAPAGAFDKPELKVSAEASWGRAAFTVSAKKDPLSRRYVKKDGEDRVVYLVSEWKIEALRKSAAELLKK